MTSAKRTPLTFRALVEAAETDPATLDTRLHELRDADVVTPDDGGYRLTDHGRALMTALAPLRRWAEAWSAR